MKFEIRREWFLDVLVGIGINVFSLLILFSALGIVHIVEPAWPLFVVGAVSVAISLPIWARLASTSPLVSINADEICFFVGAFRNKRVCVPKAMLESIDTAENSFYGEREAVLRLRFASGSLHGLRQFTFTPYLIVRADEVMIYKSHVHGDISAIVESWNGMNLRD